MEETSETLEKLNITDSSLNAVSSDFDVEEAPENLEDEFSVANEEDMTNNQRHLSQLIQIEEDDRQMALFGKSRHVFVLTENAKPVFSLHGDAYKWAPSMAAVVALLACFNDRKDNLKHIVAGSHKFVFLDKSPLILVGVSTSYESIRQINIYLEYVYDAIISIITEARLKSIYIQQKTYDLRSGQIGDADIKMITNLCESMKRDVSHLLQSHRCFPINDDVRNEVGAILQSVKRDELVYALLISNGRVVSTCRMKEQPLHTKDIQILLNYISSTTSFNTGETWTPICLPHFRSDGFLYAYVSYLDDKLQTCLILLSVDREHFYEFQQDKKVVVEKLEKINFMSLISDTIKKGFYNVRDLNIHNLLHFIYKKKELNQFTSPGFSSPYNESESRDRLLANYELIHGKVHDEDCPLKLLYKVDGKETMLAWIATSFELYATFGPLITKQEVIDSTQKILKWIEVNNQKLFMHKQFTF